MSHTKLRTQKICLNCGTMLAGKYCSNCGQLNSETRERFSHLVQHFFEDITHFDGKFFSSLKWLVTRPGYLSTQYMLGRRAGFLNPVRMYIFTSFVFFFIFFAASSNLVNVKANDYQQNIVAINLDKLPDTTYAKISAEINNGLQVPRTITKQKLQRLSTYVKPQITSLETYNKTQDTATKKDNAVERFLARKAFTLEERYNNDQQRMITEAVEKFLHTFPQALFASLPLVTLLLGLLYVRHKKYTLVNHGIFIIHVYTFIFMAFLLVMGIAALGRAIHFNVSAILSLFYTYVSYYQYRAMYKFYGQPHGKTIVKFIIFNIGILFIFSLLFILFAVFVFIKM